MDNDHSNDVQEDERASELIVWGSKSFLNPTYFD
jgi:hypothetical protein